MDWERKKGLAFWERARVVEGVVLVGGARRRVDDIVVYCRGGCGWCRYCGCIILRAEGVGELVRCIVRPACEEPTVKLRPMRECRHLPKKYRQHRLDSDFDTPHRQTFYLCIPTI